MGESFTGLLKDDLGTPEVRVDPYPLYHWLRRQHPVWKGEFGVILSRHADALSALRDPRLSSSLDHNEMLVAMKPVLIEQMGFGPLFRLQDNVMLQLDPPRHTRIRRLAGKAFTMRAVEAMRPQVQRLVDDLLDAAATRGSFDLIEHVAYPLPATVISQMLGVPLEDQPLLHDLSVRTIALLDPSDDFSAFPDVNAAVAELEAYFTDLIDARRTAPADDLLSAFIAVEDEGQRLSDEELVATMILLYVAGHETTVNLVGNGMTALLACPDQLERLRLDPSLVPAAVEEMLRYDSPVQFTGRTAVSEVEIDGTHIDKGTEVIILLAAANRDPAAFVEPDQFDVGRADNRHVAFGGGIHLCLGGPLARLEAQVLVDTLVRRFPGLRPDGEPVRKPSITLRGFESVPVAV